MISRRNLQKVLKIILIQLSKTWGWDLTNQFVKIKSIWAIVNKKDAWNQKHHHSNSDLSAAYYVSAHENCGDIVFYDPRPAPVHNHPISKKQTNLMQRLTQ